MSNEKLQIKLKSLLFADIEDFWIHLYQQKYNSLIDELCSWEILHHRPDQDDETQWLLLQTVAFLRHKVEQLESKLVKLDAGYQNFVQRIAKAELEAEKELHIINYAEELGATPKEIKQDRQAFSRWFDDGAVISRYQEQVHDIEQSLKFLISKLGTLTNQYLKLNVVDLMAAWQKLDLQPFFLALLKRSANKNIRHGLIRALVNQVSLIHEFQADPDINSELTAQLAELLEQHDIPYLAYVDILEILIHQRPTFIRAQMWALLQDATDEADNSEQIKAERLYILSALPKVLVKQQVFTDKDQQLMLHLSEHPFPRVRQSTIEQLPFLDFDIAKTILTLRFDNESVDAVRFTLVKQLTALRFAEDAFAFSVWKEVLLGEDALEIKRVALEQSARIMLNQQLESDDADACFRQFINVLNQVLFSEPNLAVKRYITRAREQLAGFYQESLQAELKQQLNHNELIHIDTQIDDDILGRTLSLLAQTRLGFNFHKTTRKKLTVRYGYAVGRRFWRVIHEFFHPSTDKRQSFSHTHSKKPSARLHVPSCTTAELSVTNVPGEPLFHFDEHSTRPYIPLLDHLLSICSQDNQGEYAKSYTPDGILVIYRPSTVFKRIKAYWAITFNFQRLDKLRKGTHKELESFISELNDLGFKLKFEAYGDIAGAPFPLESGIKQLYSRSLINPFMLSIWFSFKEYLYSIYQNSIGQLTFFSLTFIGYFWARHIHINRKIIQNRAKVPISIGGWGTRGKSGTERLKAALFSSLALKVVTKTTGCEAMMILATPSGEQYEVPIFRPFDKASIWEQSDVLAFAADVKSDVFLWECMGLTPRYVKILVRWMKDNFTTITNAYPDHEDILGPTGLDVAKEMSAFIGPHTQVFTAEQTMQPILSIAAERKQTSLIQTHWGEGFQITPDIRSLYPYEEHPDNIALVCKMAGYIGIDKDYVFKETASRIIPDVGVLQQFSAAPINGVTQTFINSMSANERLATLENWRRLDLFARHTEQHNQTIALVNNRNDRIARSKVFAEIMAHDLPFDHIVIIGTNVDGFATYFKQAFTSRIHRIVDTNDHKALVHMLSQLNLTVSPESFLSSIQVLLPNVELSLEHIQTLDTLKDLLSEHECSHRHQEFLIYRYSAWRNAQTWQESDQLEGLRESLLFLLSNIMHFQVHMIDDPAISANDLTLEISSLGAPSQHQTIVGMQNIKGAALNYVYMWQTWQQLVKDCQQLKSPSVSQGEFRRGLTKLTQRDQFNAIECDYLKDILIKVEKSPIAQSEFCQAEIKHLLSRLEQDKQQFKKSGGRKKSLPFVDFTIQVIESFLDAGAAVKRKKTAQQVYEDIASHRITIPKAITILKKLNQSQKPGWLKVKLSQLKKKVKKD